jgi:hypothetical protein
MAARYLPYIITNLFSKSAGLGVIRLENGNVGYDLSLKGAIDTTG